MATYLSHAKLNENGGTWGGTKGDQLMGASITLQDGSSSGPLEVATELWYNNANNPWTVMLRHPNTAFANAVGNFAAAIAANENVGYGQDYRNSLLEELNAHNWNLAGISPCGCDCSSMVRVCCIYAGTDPGDIYTNSEETALTAIGFQAYRDAQYISTGDNLKKGDILLKNGHTAIVSTGNADTTPTFYVWMRWTFYESGKPYDSPEALSIMGGTGNGGYGQYGFHYLYGGLIGIMQFCVDHNPSLYARFNQFIALGNGNEQLKNNTALHETFIYYAYNYTADFAWCQDTYVLRNYIEPVIALAERYNVPNLTNPYIRGALASFAIRNGVSGTTTVSAIQEMAGTSNVENQLRAGYAVFYNYYSYEGDRYIYELNECLSDMANGSNVYDLYTDSPYVPPVPPTPKKGMPIWMMIRYHI